MIVFGGIFKYPRSWAISVTLTMLRPITTTLRLNITAASIACCIRDTLDANVAKTTRPFASPTACLIAGPTELSDPVVPGFSTFVESDNSANTPLLPSSANLCISIKRPSTGVWSILKSPV